MARLNRTPAEDGEVKAHYSLTGTASQRVPVPEISRDLLDYLDVHFPDRIGPAWVDFGDVREARGQRAVVEHLRSLHKRQENKDHVPGR